VAEQEIFLSMGKISMLNKSLSLAVKNLGFEKNKFQFCPNLTPKNISFFLN
jgi:hypothetical protein